MGYRLYDWLYVEYLAVTEASRGERVGSQLLERAEALAREMSLEGIALDTFGYQAPIYYEARGYVECMVIRGRPMNATEYISRKGLKENNHRALLRLTPAYCSIGI